MSEVELLREIVLLLKMVLGSLLFIIGWTVGAKLYRDIHGE